MKLLLSAFYLILLGVGCSNADETPQTVDPVSWSEFSELLPKKVCKGVYQGDFVHPWQIRLSRFPDEATCVAQLSAVQLDSLWPDYEAAIDTGDLTYDPLLAASCLKSVATLIGDGYLHWQNAGDCALALRGAGDACKSDLWCNVGDVCSNSVCETSSVHPTNCLDSHMCETGEWCYGGLCQPRKARMAAGDRCIAWTDDGWEDIRCSAGETCDLTALDSAGTYFQADGVCAPTQPVGAYCVWDYDCDFQSICDTSSCTSSPCASECRPKLAAGSSCDAGLPRCASNRCVDGFCE